MASPDIFATDERGWNVFLPPRTPHATVTTDLRADWVIVGAGVTGLAAARRLGQRHPDKAILLLDARAIGQGASGRNSGYAVAVSHFPGGYNPAKEDEYQRVNRINNAGLEVLRETITDNAIACDWREQGFHHAAADNSALAEHDNFAAYLDALNVAHTTFNADETAERLGTTHYQKSIHVHTGALVQPAALVRGLAETLPENVTLYENTPVLSVRDQAPIMLQTPRGIVTADHAILATNYEAPRLGQLRGKLAATTLAGSFTRRLTDEERGTLGHLTQWGVLSLHAGGATVRLTADGRISLRNTAEYHGGKLLDKQTLATRQKTHREAFEQRFPQLAHVPFEHGWSGVEGISRNGTNFFAKAGQNVWLAGGYNGSGVSRGTAFGTAIADMASGAQSQLITDCLGNAPAQWIPPRPFLDIGAAWTIAKRFKNVGADR